jgi:hypothetical protein
MQRDPGSSETRDNLDANAAVIRFITDRLASKGCAVELEAIIAVVLDDGAHALLHLRDVAGKAGGGKIDIPRRAARGERGHEYTTLEHEIPRLLRSSHPGEKPFEGIEGEILRGVTSISAGKVA